MLDDFFQVGRHEDDAHSLVAQAANGLKDFLFGAEIDAAGRLVEKKDARPPVQPLADDELLLVAARKVKRIGVDRSGLKPICWASIVAFALRTAGDMTGPTEPRTDSASKRLESADRESTRPSRLRSSGASAIRARLRP